MKTTKKIEIEVIDTIICNKCGVGTSREDFTGLEEVKIKGHLSSNVLTDGVVYTFSICEYCISGIFAFFLYSAEEEEYNDFITHP